MQSEAERLLFVKIAEEPLVAMAPAIGPDIVRIYIGADAFGQDACGGLQARHMLYSGAADVDQLEQLFVDLIRTPD